LHHLNVMNYKKSYLEKFWKAIATGYCRMPACFLHPCKALMPEIKQYLIKTLIINLLYKILFLYLNKRLVKFKETQHEKDRVNLITIYQVTT